MRPCGGCCRCRAGEGSRGGAGGAGGAGDGLREGGGLGARHDGAMFTVERSSFLRNRSRKSSEEYLEMVTKPGSKEFERRCGVQITITQ